MFVFDFSLKAKMVMQGFYIEQDVFANMHFSHGKDLLLLSSCLVNKNSKPTVCSFMKEKTVCGRILQCLGNVCRVWKGYTL